MNRAVSCVFVKNVKNEDIIFKLWKTQKKSWPASYTSYIKHVCSRENISIFFKIGSVRFGNSIDSLKVLKTYNSVKVASFLRIFFQSKNGRNKG